jgi:hypothetical protein
MVPSAPGRKRCGRQRTGSGAKVPGNGNCLFGVQFFKAKSVPRLNSEIQKSNELPSLKGWIIFLGNFPATDPPGGGQEHRKKNCRRIEKNFPFSFHWGGSGIF